MQYLVKVLLIVSIGIFVGCGKPGKDTTAGDPIDTADAGQALYDQVMNIHDEMMPKMDDLHKLKQQLQEEIKGAPDMVQEKKNELEQTILQLDSASNSMMVWMHQFNPPGDSVGEEAIREYMESQLEKVKKMKEDVLEALEKGKSKD